MRPKKPTPPKVSDLDYPANDVDLIETTQMVDKKRSYIRRDGTIVYDTGSTENTTPRSLVYGGCTTGLSELFHPDAHDWEREKPEPEPPDVVCAHCAVINPFLEEIDDLMVRRGRCVACGSPLPDMDQEQVEGSPGITLEDASKQFQELAFNLGEDNATETMKRESESLARWMLRIAIVSAVVLVILLLNIWNILPW